MQWWYYDFFSDDGLIGVLAFIPHKWWANTHDSEANNSLVMLSLRKADGTVEQYFEEVDSDLFKAAGNSLKIGDCVSLIYKMEEGKGRQQLKFDIGGVSGCLEVVSSVYPFSALPLGTLSGLGRKIAYQSGWSWSQFRYVSQIPRGRVSGQMKVRGKETNFSGFAYHEQGWFNDAPHLLNKGWYWYHFLHPECNIFGLPEGYIYVQLKDKILLGGMCLFVEKYWMENKRFTSKTSSKILTGGKININCKGIGIELYLDSETNQNLIEFNSIQTGQLWNTSLVKSNCSITIQDQRYDFSGNAMIETCWLEK